MRELTLFAGAIISLSACASIFASMFHGKYFAIMRDVFAIISLSALLWTIVENIVFYI